MKAQIKHPYLPPQSTAIELRGRELMIAGQTSSFNKDNSDDNAVTSEEDAWTRKKNPIWKDRN